MAGELEGKRLACNWITFGENYYNIRFNPLYCENWLLKAYPLPMWLGYVAVYMGRRNQQYSAYCVKSSDIYINIQK